MTKIDNEREKNALPLKHKEDEENAAYNSRGSNEISCSEFMMNRPLLNSLNTYNNDDDNEGCEFLLSPKI